VFDSDGVFIFAGTLSQSSVCCVLPTTVCEEVSCFRLQWNLLLYKKNADIALPVEYVVAETLVHSSG